ncbi:MAG: aminoglycoside 6'-N-acetyltransferase [Gemmatimonadaceae bacterium]
MAGVAQGAESIAVRPVRAADAEAWLDMRVALWPEGGREEHRAEIADALATGTGDTCLVAVTADETPVGFVELSIRAMAPGCVSDRVGYLEGWYVLPGWRRRGVGRALVAAGEAWARTSGCTEFASDALIDNHISQAAHRALGFTEVEAVVCFRKAL